MLVRKKTDLYIHFGRIILPLHQKCLQGSGGDRIHVLIAVISLSLTVGNLRYPYQGSQPPVQGRVMIAASLLMPLFSVLKEKRWAHLFQVDF